MKTPKYLSFSLFSFLQKKRKRIKIKQTSRAGEAGRGPPTTQPISSQPTTSRPVHRLLRTETQQRGKASSHGGDASTSPFSPAPPLFIYPARAPTLGFPLHSQPPPSFLLPSDPLQLSESFLNFLKHSVTGTCWQRRRRGGRRRGWFSAGMETRRCPLHL